MKRSPLPRSRKPIARSPIKKRPRKKSETLRIYGPPARRAWMKTLPCSACHVVGYSEGAHVLGNGGMSRKADYDTQAPLCGPRPMLGVTQDKIWMGCHRYYDEYRSNFDRTFPDFDAERVARETEEKWLALEDTETT